jgi:hypothetical protein
MTNTNPGNPDVNETGESVQETTERASDNPAVNRCIRAWNRAYNAEFADSDDEFEAEKAGLRAYCRLMPPLAGYDNICNFIACVTYATLTEIMRQSDAEHYLEAAKIALTAVRQECKSPDAVPKRMGRPPKTTFTEGKISIAEGKIAFAQAKIAAAGGK